MSSLISINSNIAAKSAERRLSRASDELSSSLARLSSGLRINRASDDAAGLAIADRLRSDQRLYGGARRNLSDALSLVGIASGTLEQQVSILQRTIELAEQSSNGTLSSTQRRALQEEYSKLVQEFGRLGDTSEFNGLSLLLGGRNGKQSSFNIQSGISGGSASLFSVSAPDTGSVSGIVDLALSYYSTAGAQASDLFTVYAAAPDDISFDTLSSLFQNQLLKRTVQGSDGLSHTVYIGVIGNTVDNKPLFAAYEEIAGASTTYRRAGLANFAGTVSTESGALLDTNPAAVGFTTGSYTFSVNLEGIRFFDTRNNSSKSATAIDFSGVENRTRALQALSISTQRLAQLSDFRGQLGAFESRLYSASTVADASRDAVTAAESRIRNVDVASEATTMMRTQILQQTGAAVLAQANQIPVLALRLLRG